MSAPKGNQFWKLRNKHGRSKRFASPEQLWEAACEYFPIVTGLHGKQSRIKRKEK